MNRKTKSILQEISQHVPYKDKEVIFETRSNHIIESAANLLESIRQAYGDEAAAMLMNKFFLSVKQNDSEKFIRALRRLKNT